ncbi:hypothetical protein PG985_003505 [Apiospora marii]|uniref:Uncharacterized protein n=1 Tax=Apiospora marii TaxID=335849 RepID=A0ABR1SK84_9PEZI
MKSKVNICNDALHPWISEILLCVSSSALLVSIIIILARVSNHPEEEWTLQITLNSLINTLSTLYRTCLAATAAALISQHKWIWFWSAPAPGRPIHHVQAFEEGSRSLLGALNLLPTVATRHPFVILPIITLISSLAIGPFAQQSIRTVYQEVPSELGTALLPSSNSVNSSGQYFRTLEGADYVWFSLTSGPRSVIFNALANPNSRDTAISPVCPTGNCSFPTLSPTNGMTHTSIGVCSTCTDVGSLVRKGKYGPNDVYTLPNGAKLETREAMPWLSVVSSGEKTRTNFTWAEGLMTAERAALARWALVNTTVLTLSLVDAPNYQRKGKPATPVAAACSLYACLRSYAAHVREGRLSEVNLDSTPLVPDVMEAFNNSRFDEAMLSLEMARQTSGGINRAALQPLCVVDGNIYSPANASQAPNGTQVRLLHSNSAPDYPTTWVNELCMSRMENMAHKLIGGAFSTFLNGNCTWDLRSGDEAACFDRWWLAPFWEQKRASVQSIANQFESIANATTNHIRLGLLRTSDHPDGTKGRALRQVPYTHIEWSWLILPAALLVIDIVTLVYTIVRSVRHCDTEAVWKSNPLPLLYYKSRFVGPGEPEMSSMSTDFDPLEGATSEDDRLLTSAELESVAKKVMVQFRRRGAKGEDANVEGEQPGEDIQSLVEPPVQRRDSEESLLESNQVTSV